MSLEAYVWLDWQGDICAQVQRAKETIGDRPVGRLWLDVEQEAGGLDHRAILDRLRQAASECAALPAGIYTSVSKWRELTGNSREFADLPLWSAYYTSDDSLDKWGGPYGGWTECHIRQHAGDIDLCGIHVDLNICAG